MCNYYFGALLVLHINKQRYSNTNKQIRKSVEYMLVLIIYKINYTFGAKNFGTMNSFF